MVARARLVFDRSQKTLREEPHPGIPAQMAHFAGIAPKKIRAFQHLVRIAHQM